MNIDLVVTGKTNISYIAEGTEVYAGRLRNYTNFSVVTLPDIKNAKSLTAGLLKEKEGEQLVKVLDRYDYVVFLDDKGKEHTSSGFAEWLNKKACTGIRKMCFVVGGAYGFSQDAYKRADEKMSISKMTFSHQMIRLLFTEQLYRAFTILNGEPYHHE